MNSPLNNEMVFYNRFSVLFKVMYGVMVCSSENRFQFLYQEVNIFRDGVGTVTHFFPIGKKIKRK